MRLGFGGFRWKKAGLISAIILGGSFIAQTGASLGIPQTPPAPQAPGMPQASSLFRQGRFVEAQAICRAVLRSRSDDPDALSLEGRILLLGNRLRDSERMLKRALRAKPSDLAIAGRLAEIYHREGRFSLAAQWYAKAGDAPRAAQFASFGKVKPYEIKRFATPAVIKFVNTDPLPLISASVNGGKEALFLIDTGAAETTLDPEYAASVGVKAVATEQGTFAGNKTAQVQLGKIDSLRLGPVTIRNLPVNLLSTKRLSVVAGGRAVSGIIGTCLLYHFLPTLDYPEGQLVLAPKGARSTAGPNTITVAFWMAGDHYMVASGTLGKSAPHLFFVDTGLAGGAFTGPKSTLDESGIKLKSTPDGVGQGGGGPISVTMFDVDRISLGEAQATNLLGFYGPFPDFLVDGMGFQIAGLISHQFFRKYAVSFDFDSMKILLDPGPNTTKLP